MCVNRVLLNITVAAVTVSLIFIFSFALHFLPALELEEAPQYGPVDAVHPDVQAQEVPVGSAGRPLRELQGGQEPGHGAEEALLAGGAVLQKVHGRQPRTLRP